MRRTTLLFLLAFMVFLPLTAQPSDNPQTVTRLGLAFSLSEGRVDIDRFARYTQDVAADNGHFYADKAPGQSILLVPVIWLAKPLLGTNYERQYPFQVYNFLGAVVVNGTLSAFAFVALIGAAGRMGASPTATLFGGIATSFGTPLLGWTTELFAHSMTASLLALGFALVVSAFAQGAQAVMARPLRYGIGLGLAFGYCITSDLAAAPVVALGALLSTALVWRLARPVAVPFLASATVAGLAGLAPLLIYNAIAFGSPFALGYARVVGFEGMQQGFFGIGLPKPEVMAELLVGSYRGLLPIAPVLLLAPFGLFAMRHRPETRLASAVIIAVFAYYLLLNAGYYYWDGGASFGPRHMTPALPFLGLALSFAWPQRPWLRVPVLALLAVSVGIAVISAATTMSPFDGIDSPFIELILPEFMSRSLFFGAAIAAMIGLSGLGLIWLTSARTQRSTA